jgi:WS/DGAT/MGAT family acyltransferase
LSRPLWELYVIEGLNNIDDVPPGSFALLSKAHHCVMDGATAVEMAAAIHDFGPTPRDIEPEGVRIINSPPTPGRMLGTAYINALRKPGRIYKLGKNMLDQRRKMKRRDESDQTEGAKRQVTTRFNEDISPHRVLGAMTFDFADIRAIKNALEGATINDVMLAIVSGALHSYLKSKGELPDESLTCGCPIDVRDESERGKGGNVIGFMGVNLCTQIADPLKRFEAVHEAAVEAKAHAQASDVRANKNIMDTVPGGILTTVMRVTAAMGIKTTPFNTMLTNVPGPPKAPWGNRRQGQGQGQKKA